MKLLTTTIGSYPKPDFLIIRDWVHPKSGYQPMYDAHQEAYYKNRALEVSLARATYKAVCAQIDAGIDIPTDGEQGREHYIFYHLRHLQGVDFNKLQIKKIRGLEEWKKKVPTISSKILPEDRFLRYDWQLAQEFAEDHSIKITIPGPMTIADTVVDEYYGDERKLNSDLAEAINIEINDLAKAGCKWIQVDEPLFARFPDKALEYGMENIERCFTGVPKEVNKVVHLCCGYPRELDDPNPPKANLSAYFKLADALNQAHVDAVSIEDAHRYNDLSLLEHFNNTKVILGVVAIARTRVESVKEIQDRINEALKHIDANRLIIAPDCGLGMLPANIAHAKLKNLVKAPQFITL